MLCKAGEHDEPLGRGLHGRWRGVAEDFSRASAFRGWDMHLGQWDQSRPNGASRDPNARSGLADSEAKQFDSVPVITCC
jgi:hypothetical protein